MQRQYQLLACMDIHSIHVYVCRIADGSGTLHYFRFIDHGFVINAYESQIDILNKSGIPDIEAYTNMFQETLETVKSLTPIDITMQLVSWNVFCGSLLALPTALFVMRRKRNDKNRQISNKSGIV